MNKHVRKLAVILSIFAVALTSACAQLPTSGEIKTGPNIESGLETDYLYYSPSGPTEQATQEEILLGYLNAGTGPQNDYEVARSFLTQDFAPNWNPNQEVLVQDGKPTITLTDSNLATVIVPISAKINERGEYESLPSGTTRVIYVSFETENGQWRISDAPNLTMVIRPVFDVVFKAYAIYFFDSQDKQLVPDVRWFPSRASTSTRLVNALLGGPSEWLDPAVRSAIPAGTKLTLSSVTVANGVASVDLSSRALKASANDKQKMQAQIRETLLQLSNVYKVDVTIERSAIEQNSWAYPSSQVQFASPVSLVSEGLVHLDVANSGVISGSKSLIEQVSANDFAMNIDEKIVALSSPSGIYLGQLGQLVGTATLLAPGTGYLPPVVDAQGYTWVVPKSGKRPIMVFDQLARRVNFVTGWLSQLDRLSFSISSEGSRVVVVTGSRVNSRVYVAAIVRDNLGLPSFIASPIRPLAAPTVFAATWLDSTRIGTLESQASQYVQPLITMVGGDTSRLPSYTNGSSIIGSGSVTSVFMLDSFGSLYQYRGSSWTKVRDQITAFGFPAN